MKSTRSEQERLKQIQKLVDQHAEEGPRPSFVGRFVRPDVTRVLHRGSPENPRDEVMPAGPRNLGGDLGLTSKASGKQRRAAVREVDQRPENPLTARVDGQSHLASRLRQRHRADHQRLRCSRVPRRRIPKLLDWLAAEFVQRAYSRIHEPAERSETLVDEIHDSTAGHVRRVPSIEPAAERGLACRCRTRALLWRFPPKRVEAEVIRDSILQASGSLDRTHRRSQLPHSQREEDVRPVGGR